MDLLKLSTDELTDLYKANGLEVPRSLLRQTYGMRPAVRYRALLKSGGKCQCCGAAPPHVRLEIDHIKPRSIHPHLEFDESNLQVLCSYCNSGKRDWDETDWTKP